MDKLIITITVDSSMSYPGNHYCPPPEMKNIDKIVDEYVRSVNAGASPVHLFATYTVSTNSKTRLPRTVKNSPMLILKVGR
jgi:3-keto-5-aminohexanoate cleavage enzyme